MEGEADLERELVGVRCCEVGNGEHGGEDLSWVEEKGEKKEEINNTKNSKRSFRATYYFISLLK